MKKYLLFDISNMLYRTFFSIPGEDPELLTGLAVHAALGTLNKYYKKFKPNQVVFCYDRTSWRKVYTKSPKCISGKIYKGDRNKDLTKTQAEKLARFREHLNEFEELIKAHTSVIGLGYNMAEADDFIARFTQLYSENSQITVISRDKDFVQLLNNPNTTLLDPQTDRYRTLEPWDYDVKWHLFEKTIRANEDNIQCAFPNVRKTRLEKAYRDEFEMTNLMNHTWEHPISKKEFRVGDLYEENNLLMDLTRQPKTVIQMLDNEIEKQMANPGKYSHFHFLKFCGQYQLKMVVKNIDRFIPMLSS